MDENTTYDLYIGYACKVGSSEIVGIHIYADGQYMGGGNAGLVREAAVQVACSSSSANHGFDISIDTEKSTMLDGLMKEVVVYAIYSDNSSEKLDNTPIKIKFSATPGKEPPSNFGDVVGRDLSYSWGGPLNYFGHIGIWDGNNVIEVVGSVDDNTIKLTPWSDFSRDPTLWETISPVISDFRQSYCKKKICTFTENLIDNGSYTNDLHLNDRTDSKLGEMAAKSAYIKFQIGATYTRLARYTPTTQGSITYRQIPCSPFSSYCKPTYKRVEIKSQVGQYRCETFVLDAWASTSESYADHLLGQQIVIWQNRDKNIERWKKQIDYLTAWNRIMTPYNVYNNFRTAWW